MATTPRCALHSIHVPEPSTLEQHNKDWCADPRDCVGEPILVCPTGHANIHTKLARLMRGEVPLGRPGLTGKLALKAYYYWKDYINV